MVTGRCTARSLWAGTINSPDAHRDLSYARHLVCERFGLWCHSAGSPVRDLGFSDTRTAEGYVRASPFGTAEAIDAHTALKSHTIWAARQIFQGLVLWNL
jgi:hypothetical protein